MWPFKKRAEPQWKPVIQSGKIEYPTGSVVRTASGTYFIRKNFKYRIPSDRVLDSWKFNSVAAAHAEVLAPYKYAGVLGFRDGTMIEDISTRKIYLISGNRKRHITDPDAFDRYGLNRALVVEVSAEEARLHEDGEDLN